MTTRKLFWEPCTLQLTDAFERWDGKLTDGTNFRYLDIASIGDDCCVTSEEAAQAAQIWEQGEVLVGNVENHGVTTLVVPKDILNSELVIEALKRFLP